MKSITRMVQLWKWISGIGNSQVPESELRSVIIMNRINFLLILFSFIGFAATVIIYWLLPKGGPGLGALRLLLMMVVGIISLYLTHKKHYLASKVLTSVIPEFLLIIFPTLLGDVKNEYYFYYPLGAVAFAIVPILVFHVKNQRTIVIVLIGYSFLLALTADILLSLYSVSGTLPDFVAERYFFYKISQILLFSFMVLIVFALKESNTAYEIQLAEQNHQLEKYKNHLEDLVSNRTRALEESLNKIKEAEGKVVEAIIHTEENERSRIAQDLHDGLGPILSTIKIYWQVYQDAHDENKKKELREKLKTTIEEAIRSVSEISHNISPHVLKNHGFYPAIRQFIHRIELASQIHFHLNCGEETVLNENTGITLYRSITELVNNSIKHAGCKNISIAFERNNTNLEIHYRDDGKGFDSEFVTSGLGNGSGVRNVINRINALHGTVTFSSLKGEGMTAKLSISL